MHKPPYRFADCANIRVRAFLPVLFDPPPEFRQERFVSNPSGYWNRHDFAFLLPSRPVPHGAKGE
jgi:hypothetical protein